MLEFEMQLDIVMIYTAKIINHMWSNHVDVPSVAWNFKISLIASYF